jgi:hypothetical protein
MIPKLAFAFWEGKQFTYLHALTVISFQKYNPDYKIIIYLSKQIDCDLVQWNTGEQSLVYTNLYDIYELKKINNVDIIEIDVKIQDYDKPLSSVWKSDIIRLAKLYEHGGIYIDFDMLFIGKIPDYLLNNDKFMLNRYMGTYSNGYMMSMKENKILKLCLDDIYFKLQNNMVYASYMQFGPNLLNTFITNEYKLEDEVYLIPIEYNIPYLPTEIDLLYSSPIIDKTTANTFAIHWYNGNQNSRKYCNNLNILNINPSSCIFEKKLYNIACDLLYYNNHQYENEIYTGL